VKPFPHKDAFWKGIWPWLAMALLAGAVHWTALDGAFVFDDTIAAAENPVATAWPPDWEGIGTTNYWGDRPGYEKNAIFRPLVTLSFSINRHLLGEDAGAYRVGNLLLHVLATLLAGLFCLVLTRSPITAFLAGVLFAVHPVHSDAVASIANRTELLCACTYLGALILYLRGRADPAGPRWRWFTVSLVVFALALCSKENAVTFPGVILLCEGWFAWQRKKEARDWFTELRWGYLACSVLLVVAYLGWRVAILPEPFGGATPPQDNPIVDAGLLGRLMTPFKQFAVALEVLLVPIRLTADYTVNALPVVTTLFDPMAWSGLTAFVLLTVFAIRGAKKGSFVAFGVIFFGITYALVSNTLILSTIIFAERLLYLPSVGFCLVVAVWLVPWLNGPRGKVVWVGFAALILLLGMRSMARDMDWSSESDLMRSSLEARPQSAKLHSKLGKIALDEGDLERARHELETAVSIYPNNTLTLLNLGIVEQLEGNLSEAERLFWQADSTLPEGLGEVFNALCSVRVELNRFDEETKRVCEEALGRRSHEALVIANYARYLGGIRESDGARRAFEHALQLEPTNLNVLKFYGKFLQERKLWDPLIPILFQIRQQEPGPALEQSLHGLVLSRIQRALQENRRGDAARMHQLARKHGMQLPPLPPE